MEHEERRSRKLKMTPAWVKVVKPEAGPVEWRDTVRPGLVLRVETSGTRTWVYRYTTDVQAGGRLYRRERRYVLGDYPGLTLSQARDDCREALRKRDPQAERERAREAEAKRKLGETVAEAVATWLKDPDGGPATGLGTSKPRAWKGGDEGGTSRSFLPHVRALGHELAGVRLLALSPEDCRRFVSGATKGAELAASTRNHRLAVVRAFVAWARKRGLLETDPAAEIRKHKERPRRRVLSDDELRAFVLGFDHTRLGPAVRLLALTACRRDEVLSARWEWCDLEAGVMRIPAEASKEGDARGEERLVALSAPAVELLKAQRKAQLAEGSRSPWIFATRSGARPHADSLKPVLYRLKGLRSNGRPTSTDKRAKPRPALLPADVRIHDVRRTVAHALVNRLGVLPWLVDRVILAHYRSKDEATYVPDLGGKPLEEAREALTRWAGEVARILAAEPKADAR